MLLLKSLAVLAATSAALVAAQGPIDAAAPQTCPQKCDQWSPCCAKGFCMTQPFACMISEGCNKDMSAKSDICTERPMCKSWREDFNDPKVIIDKYNYTGNPDDGARFWREYPGADIANVVDGNLVLEMRWSDKVNRGQGATIPSIRWMQYGSISARIKTAGGKGVVNSFITKTDISDKIGDEIDFEMLGANPSEVQTNYYWNGQLDWTKGGKWNFDNGGSTSGDYHVYTIDWQPDRLRWLVDGKEIRSLTPSQTNNKYPSQVARIFFSIWDAGCNQAEGTVQWAGGETDWCKDASKRSDVKKMYIDWIEVKCLTEDTKNPADYVPKIPKPSNGTAGGAGGDSGTPMPTRQSGGGSGSGSASDAFNGAMAPLVSWTGAAVAVAAMVLA